MFLRWHLVRTERLCGKRRGWVGWNVWRGRPGTRRAGSAVRAYVLPARCEKYGMASAAFGAVAGDGQWRAARDRVSFLRQCSAANARCITAHLRAALPPLSITGHDISTRARDKQ